MLEEEKSLIEERKRLRDEALQNEVLRLKEKDKRYQKINRVLKYVVLFQAMAVILVGAVYLAFYFTKEPQTNSIQTSSQSDLHRSIAVKDSFPEILFSVQISTYKNVSLEEFKKEMVNIGQYTYEDLNQFTLGKFAHYSDAVEFMKRIKKIGFQDAFVVATKNGTRMDIKEAIRESHNNSLKVVNDSVR